MTTNLNYPKPVKPDDGCNWLPVILWRMNAGARARSRSVFVAAPRPAPVPGITPQKPIKREIIAPTVSGRRRKTHIGTVIYSRGEKTFALAKVRPSGLLAPMSISIKNGPARRQYWPSPSGAGEYPPIAGQRRTTGRPERHRAATGIRDERQNAFLPGHSGINPEALSRLSGDD